MVKSNSLPPHYEREFACIEGPPDIEQLWKVKFLANVINYLVKYTDFFTFNFNPLHKHLENIV